MSAHRASLLSVVLLASQFAFASEPPTAAPAEVKAPQSCDHGVRKTLCTRCNPKLVPVFKKKGDWCSEHQVPESQCVRCNPELAKEGVK